MSWFDSDRDHRMHHTYESLSTLAKQAISELPSFLIAHGGSITYGGLIQSTMTFGEGLALIRHNSHAPSSSGDWDNWSPYLIVLRDALEEAGVLQPCNRKGRCARQSSAQRRKAVGALPACKCDMQWACAWARRVVWSPADGWIRDRQFRKDTEAAIGLRRRGIPFRRNMPSYEIERALALPVLY